MFNVKGNREFTLWWDGWMSRLHSASQVRKGAAPRGTRDAVRDSMRKDNCRREPLLSKQHAETAGPRTYE
jgi:hypothetical protein